MNLDLVNYHSIVAGSITADEITANADLNVSGRIDIGGAISALGLVSALNDFLVIGDSQFSFHPDGDPNDPWIPAHTFLRTGEIGFFDATPRAQYTFGDATASGSYGATEQTMLQKCYDALRAFGLAS